jgi:hypothetical protein
MILLAKPSLRQPLWDQLSSPGMDWTEGTWRNRTALPDRRAVQPELYGSHKVSARKRRTHE